MHCGVHLIYLLWLIFLTAEVLTSDHPTFLRRFTRHIYNYGSQNKSLYPNYQNQPQTLNNPGQQPWDNSPNQYREQTYPRLSNNNSYANNYYTHQNSYHNNNYTNKPLTWNGTGPQWQPTAAPFTNMYLKSQTPPPGLGPGLVYYTVPPNQQPQINRTDNRWNSSSHQNIHARFGRAAHQSRHQNLSWYNIHPNWYNNKPPAWNGTAPSWNQPGGQYFQWNMTDSNNSTYVGPCRDNYQPGHHHHHHRHHEHRHNHNKDNPPPPPEFGPPPHGASTHFGPPPSPQFGPPNFNRPPSGWYPSSYCNNTLPDSNATVTPSTNPSDIEVGTGTNLSSTQENEVVGNRTEFSMSGSNEEGNSTNLWSFEVRDLNGSNETDGNNSTPRPE